MERELRRNREYEQREAERRGEWRSRSPSFSPPPRRRSRRYRDRPIVGAGGVVVGVPVGEPTIAVVPGETVIVPGGGVSVATGIAVNTPGGVHVPGVAPGVYERRYAAAKNDGDRDAKKDVKCGSDKGIVYDEHNVFKTRVALRYRGTSRGLAAGGDGETSHISEVKAEDVPLVFPVQLINPDVVLTDEKALTQDADTSHMFIVHVEVLSVYSSLQTHAHIVANAPLADLNVVFMNGSPAHTAMVSIPPNTNHSYGHGGMVLKNRRDQLRSGVFRKYGHVNLRRLIDDMAHPNANDADQRVRIDGESTIAGLVARYAPEIKLTVPEWDGDVSLDADGKMRVPLQVATKALSLYEHRVKPLTPGIVDARNGISFELGIDLPSDAPDDIKNAFGEVEVDLAISYAYPRSELDKYTGSKHKSAATFEDMFYTQLNKDMNALKVGK